MKYLVSFTAFFLFLSCGEDSADSANSELSEDSTTEEMSIEESVIEEFIESEELFNPEMNYEGFLLQAGEYHEDEITTEPEITDWMGLFKNNHDDGYGLWKTDLVFDRVEDPFAEEGEAPTAWGVSSTNVHEPLFFFGGLDYLTDGSIKSYTLEKKEIYPGDMLKFSFLDVDYQLYATGQKVHIDGDYYQVENYKLFLMTAINGEKRTSQLSNQTRFDDAMVSILFAGDIDKDGLLDLIIDDTYHYNVTNPTLFLSKPAKEGETLNAVAAHFSVGC